MNRGLLLNSIASNSCGCTEVKSSAYVDIFQVSCVNPLNTKYNPICYLLALLGAHHILKVSRVRVKGCSSTE